MDLNQATVIVTGAGRGIGRALAIGFGRAGANVVCAARSMQQIEETARMVEESGGRAIAVATDIVQQEETLALVRATLDKFGAIDILFNNAGRFAVLGGLWEVDPDDWWLDVTVNLRGTMLMCRAVLPHMMEKKRGIIINMRGGDRIPGGTGYSCSKVAVSRLTELMAREQEREKTGVLVFGMGPGFVRTEMTEMQITTPIGEKWLPSSREAIAAGRDRSPDDCARTTIELIKLAYPELNGESFSAGQTRDDILARKNRQKNQ